MHRSPLLQTFVDHGARVGAYSRTETALEFSGARAELDALRSGCGVYDLAWRSKLVLTGEDRVRWLNGMVTNNVRDLPLNRANYSFLLNAQGRILGDCYTYNRGEYLLLDTEENQTETLLALFDKFIIMDDVEVTDVTAKLTGIAVHGPESERVLTALGFCCTDVEPMELRDLTWRGIGCSLTRMASEEFLTYEVWFAPENAATVWKAVVEAGGVPVGTEALELFRIAAGVPKYGVDVRERDLPQETNQDYALNFSKGCYIGQEIVERVRSRGQVHRTLTGYVLDGLVERGVKVQREGKDVGEITSVARVPSKMGERVLALGYVRREHGAPGTEIQVGEIRGTVSEIPFPEAKA